MTYVLYLPTYIKVAFHRAATITIHFLPLSYCPLADGTHTIAKSTIGIEAFLAEIFSTPRFSP